MENTNSPPSEPASASPVAPPQDAPPQNAPPPQAPPPQMSSQQPPESQSSPPQSVSNSTDQAPRHSAPPQHRSLHSGKRPPPGTRLFVGNLKSEETSKEEFRGIFEKYGEVLEVAIHRSFAFVQFKDAPALEAAMQAEQGRMIGSKPIDLQVAKDSSRRNTSHDNRRDNRRDNRGNYRNNDRRRNYRDDRGRYDRGGRDRSRDRSPGRDRHRRDNHGHRPPKEVTPPKNGMVVKIILLGEQQRNFAEQAASGIREIGVPYEIVMLDGRTLGQALRDAEENKSRYALIVGRENQRKQSITTKLLHLKEEGGRCPTFDLRVHEVVDKIFDCERDLGFLDSDPRFKSNQNPPPNQNILPQQGSSNPAALSAVAQQLQALQQQLQQMQNQPNANSNRNLGGNQYSNPNFTTAPPVNSYSNQHQNMNQNYGNPPPSNNQYHNSSQPHPPPSYNNNQYSNNYRSETPTPPPNTTAQLANLSKLLSTLQQNNADR